MTGGSITNLGARSGGGGGSDIFAQAESRRRFDAQIGLNKAGIAAGESLVIHDELDKPFGHLSFRQGGSARGHNGLKSLIAHWGTNEFPRLRFGIGRPEHKAQVPDYVLERFDDLAKVDEYVQEAVSLIDTLYEKEEG